MRKHPLHQIGEKFALSRSIGKSREGAGMRFRPGNNRGNASLRGCRNKSRVEAAVTAACGPTQKDLKPGVSAGIQKVLRVYTWNAALLHHSPEIACGQRGIDRGESLPCQKVLCDAIVGNVADAE